jgi:DNA-binding ferritin-like protein (Dps family)
VQKLWPEVKSVGHIPGLKEDDILTVVLNAKGRAEQLDLENKRMTAEDVRQVAASLLTQSEKEHEEKLSHQITRHED